MNEPAACLVREFRYPEDYPLVRDLWSRSGPGVQVRRSDEPAEIEKKLLRDPDLFLVAETRGQIIGAVIGGFDGRRGMVYHLAVDSQWRQHGIGGILMDELERRLRARGCIRAYLMVVQGNEAAGRFYEKRGWEPMSWVTTYGKDLS
jgi:ribosomal protein S18 acetylase RimI-like enzyme